MIITVDVSGKTIVDINREEVTIDVDESELLREMGGTEAVLDMLDYGEIVRYVAEIEDDKAAHEAELRGDDGQYIR